MQLVFLLICCYLHAGIYYLIIPFVGSLLFVIFDDAFVSCYICKTRCILLFDGIFAFSWLRFEINGEGSEGSIEKVMQLLNRIKVLGFRLLFAIYLVYVLNVCLILRSSNSIWMQDEDLCILYI